MRHGNLIIVLYASRQLFPAYMNIADKLVLQCSHTSSYFLLVTGNNYSYDCIVTPAAVRYVRNEYTTITNGYSPLSHASSGQKKLDNHTAGKSLLTFHTIYRRMPIYRSRLYLSREIHMTREFSRKFASLPFNSRKDHCMYYWLLYQYC